MSKAYLIAGQQAYKHRKPLAIGLGVSAVAVGGFLLFRQNSRRAWFRAAADGNVNAIAAQKIGELLPEGWKNANLLVRSLAPSWAFRAAKEVEEFFRSQTFKTRMLNVTETVTDPREFEAAFRAMWGFSFMGALEKNLSSGDGLQIMESLRREKVTRRPAAQVKGLFMVSKKQLTAADIAVIIGGSVFGVARPVPAGLILGKADGNLLAKGKIKEGYTADITYTINGVKKVFKVIADKNKVEFLTGSQVQARGLKYVSSSYIKK